MKKTYSYINIQMEKSVNLTEEDIQEAEKIEDNPDKILALIDLLFLYEENKKVIPS